MEKFLPKLYAYELREMKEELVSILKYREMLAGGGVVPPRSEEIVSKRVLPDGRVEVVKKVVVTPPDVKVPEVVSFAREAVRKKALPQGYWLYMKTEGLSTYDVARVYCLAQKAYFTPEVLFDLKMVVFGVYPAEEDAYTAEERLKEAGIDVELVEVRRNSAYVSPSE